MERREKIIFEMIVIIFSVGSLYLLSIVILPMIYSIDIVTGGRAGHSPESEALGLVVQWVTAVGRAGLFDAFRAREM